MLSGLKQFILRGNVLDLAVGVVIGAAFNSVVQSLVKDLFTPFIAAIVRQPDFSKWSFTVNDSAFQYGDFLNNLISFLIVAFAVYFFVIVPMNAIAARFKKEPPPPNTKRCPYCLSDIPSGPENVLFARLICSYI